MAARIFGVLFAVLALLQPGCCWWWHPHGPHHCGKPLFPDSAADPAAPAGQAH
jgi:hypothetical protein